MKTAGTLAIAMLISATAACTNTAALEVPPDVAAQTPGDGAIVTKVSGVEIVARPDAWRGESIDEHVTPLQTTIRNDGNRPLKIRYEAFSLVSSDGRRYNALPPFAVEGETAARRGPFTPAFRHRYFHVAPYFGHHFAGLSVTHHPFHHHGLSYGYYYDYWDRVPLPTDRMLEQAIPEGVLEPGGSISGFLYFEPVDPEEQQVTFRTNLVDAARGHAFGEIQFPLLVQSG